MISTLIGALMVGAIWLFTISLILGELQERIIVW